jgi:hypothetical protein
MRNFEQLRYDFFRRIIDKNVLREPSWRERLNNAFLSWAMSVQPPASDVIPEQGKYERAADNPLTQNYFESAPVVMTHPGGVGDWLAEVARVIVPKSRVGVVKGFEQFLVHDDIAGDTVFSRADSWGNPFLASDIAAVDSVRWLWRIEPTTGAVPAMISQVNPPMIPGIPHPNVPEMTDLWFPATSAAAQNIHVTIGGGNTLRVFALITLNAEYALRVAAKVKGFTISQYDPMTKIAIRSIW